jgi:ABC-type transport system substrate-binding protein
MASPAWLAKANPAQGEQDATIGAQPVGTGPFKFVSWQPGEGGNLVVEKNPDYWQKDADGNALPYLDKITFRVIADEPTRAQALEAGDLDLISTDSGENVARFRGQSKYSLIEQDKYTETFHILLNLGKPDSPLADQRVRCGLSAAVDKEVLRDTTGGGILPIANGMFSPGQQGYLADNGAQGHDPAKAAELIAAYTAEKGKPKIIYSHVTDSVAATTAELYKQWWTAAGVDVELQPVEQQKLILNALVGDPSFDAFGWRNHAGLLLDNQYFWWHGKNAAPSGTATLNFSRLNDSVINTALDTARTTTDPAVAQKAAEDVNRRFAEQCYTIPTTWAIWGIAFNPAIKNVGNAPLPGGGKLRDGAGFPGQIWFNSVWLQK